MLGFIFQHHGAYGNTQAVLSLIYLEGPRACKDSVSYTLLVSSLGRVPGLAIKRCTVLNNNTTRMVMIMVYLCNGMIIIIIIIAIIVIIICIYTYLSPCFFLYNWLVYIYIYINCIRDTMIVAIVYSATKGICDYIYICYMLYVYMIL